MAGGVKESEGRGREKISNSEEANCESIIKAQRIGENSESETRKKRN